MENRVIRESFQLVRLLKACVTKKDLLKGRKLHADILRRGLLEECPYLASSLISMYANCGALNKASRTLEHLQVQDVASWNALISGYIKHGKYLDAISCLEQIQYYGLSPDSVTFTCLLKACHSIGDLDKGKKIHDDIVTRGLLEKDISLGTSLIDMYAKCGMLSRAQKVLEDLHVRNVVSWNTLMIGYIQNGQYHQALHCFEEMQDEGFSPDAVTFTCILKACGNIGYVDRIKQIHGEIVDRGLLKKDILLGNALVDTYSKCGMLPNAHKVLEEIPDRNVATWNSLIAGYTRNGQGQVALNCLEQMQDEGISPDEITFTCTLKACSSIGAVDKGTQIHNEIIDRHLLEKNVMLGTALVDMYAKCGFLEKAERVLQDLSVRNAVSWNALIAGYVQEEQSHKAISCFEMMQNEGIPADDFTFACILKVCGNKGDIQKGKRFHDMIIMKGLHKTNLVLATALMDMYGKCGMAVNAEQVFQELVFRDIICWSAFIAGHAHQGKGQEALNYYERMHTESVAPDAVIVSCILKACGSTGAIDKGKKIHNEILIRGMLGNNILLGTALVDMYAKCGGLAQAQKVLEELPIRNEVSWSALIAGYAQHGQGHDAMKCFEQMQNEGLFPDAVTFLSLLNACSHTGLLDEAQMYFEYMSSKYGVAPDIEHHICLAIVFGSAGHFEMAMRVINTMLFSDHLTAWLTLLGACRKWGNVKLAILTFNHTLNLDNKCASAYVLMADIFAASGMQKDAAKVLAMKEKIFVEGCEQ